MVVRIVSGKSIRGLLNYNENKVEAGKAELLMASLFGAELNRLSFTGKLNRFEHLTDLNSRVKTNALHFMLNFDPSEKPGTGQLQQIALTYMERIGFGDQPYLVYCHHDAAHPHIHIVTTNIQPNGKRISIHNLGRTLSEQARKEIEIQFGLVKADGRVTGLKPGISAASPEVAEYGKTPTKQAIANVVIPIIRDYQFASLTELNTLLKQFNVLADRGPEGSRMYERHGLVYSIIDDRGQRIGIPIKAGDLPRRPTLKQLEQLFPAKKDAKQHFKENLKSRVAEVMKYNRTLSRQSFTRMLEKQNIEPVFHQNDIGFTYGVSFIDHQNKVIFKGSELGKEYGAKALLSRFSREREESEGKKPELRTGKEMPAFQSGLPETSINQEKDPSAEQLVKSLTGQTPSEMAPLIARPKRKKKKRRTV